MSVWPAAGYAPARMAEDGVTHPLFRLHQDLPREAPGSAAETRAALALVRPRLPSRPRVADLACGTGPASRILAEELGVPVVALDLHAPFLARLRRETAALPIRAVRGDLARLPFAEGSLDLIWCEGAAYVLGLEAALAAWRPLLAPGGVIALTECCWLVPDPPAGAAAFWGAAYPGMRTLDACRELTRSTGLELLAARPLPAPAWEEYYGPLRRRVASLEPEAREDPPLAAVLAETREELSAWERWGGSYGYAWLLLRAPD